MLKNTTLKKRLGLSAALGALTLMGSPTAYSANLETDLKAFYRVSGYGVENKNINKVDGSVSDKDTGISHVLRIGLDLKDVDTGVAIHSSVELAGDRWKGNRRDYGTQVAQFNDTVRSEDIRLDYAYVSLPISEHGKLNIGRQTTSYNNCLLVCEGRRDRISLLQPITPSLMGILNYDRNSDTESFNRLDNGDLVFFGVMGKPKGIDVGFLNFHWLHNYKGTAGAQDGTELHALSGVHLISTYIGGNITEDVKLTAGTNYTNNGRVKGAEGQVFHKRSFAGYLRAEADLNLFNFGLQYVFTKDGGLINPGFDSYSSLINNSPDATATPTSLYHMGGENGLRKADDQIIAAKADYKASEKLTLTAAIGNLNVKRPAVSGTDSDDSMFYDLQASYQMNDSVRLWATAGLLEKNKVGTLNGNPHLYREDTPAGANLFGSFADKNVMATSLNMVVKF